MTGVTISILEREKSSHVQRASKNSDSRLYSSVQRVPWRANDHVSQWVADLIPPLWIGWSLIITPQASSFGYGAVSDNHAVQVSFCPLQSLEIPVDLCLLPELWCDYKYRLLHSDSPVAMVVQARNGLLSRPATRPMRIVGIWWPTACRQGQLTLNMCILI